MHTLQDKTPSWSQACPYSPRVTGENGQPLPQPKAWTRIVLCAVVLLAGLAGMAILSGLGSPPEEKAVTEIPLAVETVKAVPAPCAVHLKGYGQIRPLDSVDISPEVSGCVASVHPRLETGETIAKGEVLFAIDPPTYQAALRDAQAELERNNHVLEKMRREEIIARLRMEDLQRNLDLAETELDRYRQLFEDNQAVSRSALDAQERALNAARESVAAQRMDVDVYPIRIQETLNAIESAKARRDRAKTDLDHCSVRAPFTGRIKAVHVERGQYLSPGQNVLTLADDSILEIIVPLDADQAAKWLKFFPREDAASNGTFWFAPLKPVTCQVRWASSENAPARPGILHRVVRFNDRTRTLEVAVRLNGKTATTGGFPLAEGMLCHVAVPGREIAGTLRLPRHSVSYEGKVRVNRDGRLKTLNVEVAHRDDKFVYVSKGLLPHEHVIVSPLSVPLENSLLLEHPMKDRGIDPLPAKADGIANKKKPAPTGQRKDA